MRPNTTRVCRVLRRVGFRCVHAATSLVLFSPGTSCRTRRWRCTGPRLSDGLAGLARRLGWPCHFMTACEVGLLQAAPGALAGSLLASEPGFGAEVSP